MPSFASTRFTCVFTVACATTSSPGYAIACAGVFLDYWTQWTGNYADGDGIEATIFTVAWLVTVPGFLLTMLCSTAVGATLLVTRFRPTLPAVLLLATIPLALGILMVTSMGSAALP
jgi:hypothetical protein